ncbi:germacradienol/geosmin synthase [Actinomadura sp. DC4]|uniref:terpene synthase family protein n=1 Tax=Actinomadura sp. DC4 TaxID=3055069 RepID=UPI0025B0E775|nr:germacradienol/geosmin synthase [Actinomadura sp. DC4]MDN3357667.1 germacradienol/geosmin synthase [Actinomadura sp. DC4]
MADRPFELPRFSLPHPARLNPHVDAARTRVRSWARRMGMLDEPALWTEADLDAHDYGLLSASTHPDCGAVELGLLSGWYAWVFYFADHFRHAFKRPGDLDGARTHLDRLAAFLADDAPEPVSPVERGLADLWPRTLPAMSPAWRERFAAGTHDLFAGAMWELRNLEAGRVPNPVEYVRMRRRYGGAPWAARLVEHALAAEVPADLATERPLRVLEDTFADSVHLRDDLFSYRSEAEEGEVSNGVLVLEEFLGLTPSEAADTTNDLITSRMHQFEDTALTELPMLYTDHAVSADEQAVIAAHVRALRDWQAGADEWHRRSSRYPDEPPGLGAPATRPASPRPPGTPGAPCTPGHPFRLPLFFMPWRATTNPHLEAARRGAKAWAYEMGMIGPVAARGDGVWTDARFDSLALAVFAALTHPLAGPDKLRLVTLWDVWMFALDDYALAAFKAHRDLPGARAFVAGLPEFMPADCGPTPPPRDCVERGLADLWARTAPNLPATVRTRFPGHVLAFAEGNLWELGNTVQNRIPDPVDYTEMRRRTAGTELATSLGFLMSGTGISAELLAAEPLRQLVIAFADNVDFRNDVFSYRKEIEFEGDVNNGVLVIQDFLNCGLQHAVEIANDIMTASLREFQRIVQEDLPVLFEELRLDVTACDQVLTFVRSLERWMCGDLAWYSRTGRYAGSDLETGPERPGAGTANGLGTSAVRRLGGGRTSLP